MFRPAAVVALLIAAAALPACTSTRSDLAIVEPTYSYVRDYSPSPDAGVLKRQRAIILSSDARPERLFLRSDDSSLLGLSLKDAPTWWAVNAPTEQ